MKKNFVKIFSLFLMLTVILSTGVIAASFDLPQCPVKSIDVDDSYSVCTRNYKDESLDKIFDSQTQMSSDEKLQLIGFVIETGSQVVLYVDQPDIGTDENALEKKLSEDYNMAENINDKIDNLKTTLTNASCVVESTELCRFEGVSTPYIMSNYSSGDRYFTQFNTVYGGNEVTLQFIDSSRADDATIQNYKLTAESIVFSDKVDYTSTQKYISSKKLEEAKEASEEHTQTEKSSNIIFWLVVLVAVGGLVFSVYMATRKRKKSLLKNSKE